MATEALKYDQIVGVRDQSHEYVDGPLQDAVGSLLRWTFAGRCGFIATMDLCRTLWVHCYDGPLQDAVGSLLRCIEFVRKKHDECEKYITCCKIKKD